MILDERGNYDCTYCSLLQQKYFYEEQGPYLMLGK
jgi:hypothetical protein